MDISFRPLERGDLPLLRRWFHAPHAERWYGKGAPPSEIDDEYLPILDGELPIRSFIGAIDGRAVGLFDTNRLGDFPEIQAVYGIDDPDTANRPCQVEPAKPGRLGVRSGRGEAEATNCDILLGEADAAHRGVGPAMIEAFLARVVFADQRFGACIIDPEADNAIAIRAYEKAGFRFVRTADDGEGTHVFLMELARAELGLPRAPTAWLRPGRAGELDVADAIDDDASLAYADVGLAIDLEGTPDFFAHERARWAACLAEQRLLFACDPGPDGGGRRAVGFAAFGHVDDLPYLHQIAVERAAMRRGFGRLLIERALHWSAGEGELWLTTYAGVPFNDGWYARLGFEVVPERGAPPAVRAIVADERAALPAPERRIAMRYRHASPFRQFAPARRRDR